MKMLHSICLVANPLLLLQGSILGTRKQDNRQRLKAWRVQDGKPNALNAYYYAYFNMGFYRIRKSITPALKPIREHYYLNIFSFVKKKVQRTKQRKYILVNPSLFVVFVNVFLLNVLLLPDNNDLQRWVRHIICKQLSVVTYSWVRFRLFNYNICV